MSGHSEGRSVGILRTQAAVIPQGFCGFVVRASIFGGSSGEPRGSPVLARAARSANPFESPPSFSSEDGGFIRSLVASAQAARDDEFRATSAEFRALVTLVNAEFERRLQLVKTTISSMRTP